MAVDEGIRLSLYPAGPDAFRDLDDALIQIKHGDPLAPVTVVGPYVYANLSLRHRLGRSGFANVRFMVLPRLAELLGAPSLASQGRSPLTPILEGALVRFAASESSGVLEGVRAHPSTIRSLANSFRQLRHASAEALERLETQSELQRDVVQAYRRFREAARPYYDREDLANAAATAIHEGTASGLTDLGAVILFQLRDITPGEREMIEALASAWECRAIFALSGDEGADSPVRALAGRLSETLGAPREPNPSASTQSTRLLVAPDPHQEVRWVIRNMMSHSESGVPLHRMAVLYRSQAPYGTLIREELHLAGIPIAGPDSTVLSETAVGRTLNGFIGLWDGELTRDAVTAWLTGCPVKPPGAKADDFSPSWWDAISQRAGIVGGQDQWGERLERYARKMDQLSQRGETLGEVSGTRALGMQSEAVAARAMKDFISDLAEKVVPPADGSAWAEFSDWAKSLLDRYLVHESDLPESEQGALEKIKENLDDLRVLLDDVLPDPTFSDFVQALDESLQRTLGHLGVTGQGVFVAPVYAAAAMEFDVVYVVGMTEGAFPPAVRDDPLIPDRARDASGGPSAGLPLQRARRDDERYAYLMALATAPNRVLSFPRANPAGQRAFYPSRWFLEQASHLEGAPVYTSTFWSLGERPWLTNIPSAEQALAAVASESAADLNDRDLAQLWSWKESGRSLGSHPLAQSGVLAQAMDMGSKRFSDSFSEWDGDVSHLAEGSAMVAALSRRVTSPTSLERWAKCPFSYFLGSVLRLSSLEKPEEVFSITPLEKGSLVHEILEKFVRQPIESKTLPVPGQAWSNEQRSELHSIAQRAFQDAEDRGITGKPLLWQLVKTDILSDLDSFLEADNKQRERFGVSPKIVEARFGMSGDSWPEVSIDIGDGETLRFRGMIDRVDTDVDGKIAIVVDYKTGSARTYDGLKQDPVDGGKRLQLPIYALAVENALGDGIETRAAYWFVSARGNFALLPSEPVSMDEIREPFENAARTIVSGIRNGLFPANPGKMGQYGFENCSYCDFNSLCPTRRDVQWEQKRRDPRLAEYLALSGEGAD